MSAALLDDLLADYVAPVRFAFEGATPANSAKGAKSEETCGPAPTLAACEGLRIPANSTGIDSEGTSDSQTFAGIRKPPTSPGSVEASGSSQDSQNSQGCRLRCATVSEASLAAVVWADGDIARFLERRGRLLRWGWTTTEAENLAERLTVRDREHDDRVNCVDCQHCRPGRCNNHHAAHLHTPEVSRDLATLLQRCPGFLDLRT